MIPMSKLSPVIEPATVVFLKLPSFPTTSKNVSDVDTFLSSPLPLPSFVSGNTAAYLSVLDRDWETWKL